MLIAIVVLLVFVWCSRISSSSSAALAARWCFAVCAKVGGRGGANIIVMMMMRLAAVLWSHNDNNTRRRSHGAEIMYGSWRKRDAPCAVRSSIPWRGRLGRIIIVAVRVRRGVAQQNKKQEADHKPAHHGKRIGVWRAVLKVHARQRGSPRFGAAHAAAAYCSLFQIIIIIIAPAGVAAAVIISSANSSIRIIRRGAAGRLAAGRRPLVHSFEAAHVVIIISIQRPTTKAHIYFVAALLGPRLVSS